MVLPLSPAHVLDVAANVGLLLSPVAGWAGYALAEANDSSVPPTVIGLGFLLVTAIVAPVVKWAMRRADRNHRVEVDRKGRRERREDLLQDALVEQLTAQVVALTSIASDLREMVALLRERAGGSS